MKNFWVVNKKEMFKRKKYKVMHILGQKADIFTFFGTDPFCCSAWCPSNQHPACRRTLALLALLAPLLFPAVHLKHVMKLKHLNTKSCVQLSPVLSSNSTPFQKRTVRFQPAKRSFPDQMPKRFSCLKTVFPPRPRTRYYRFALLPTWCRLARTQWS